MKRKITIILSIIFISTVPLFSVGFDWGGALQNTTDFKYSEAENLWSPTQVDSLSLWMELNVSPLFNMKASGGYRFMYSDETVSHIPEFGAFYAYGGNKQISYKAGRFAMKDNNNRLFSTIFDGASFGYKNELFKISSGVGFTGLVFSDNSSVTMTSLDYQAVEDNALLASPRLFEYAETSLFILPGDGQLNIALLAQQDMRASSSLSSQEGLLHTFYLNVGVKGRLGSLFFYNLYGTGELGTYNMSADDRQLLLIAGAGGLRIDLPLPLPLKPLISVDLYISSGDDWGRTDHNGSFIEAEKEYLYQYTPFTLQNKGYVYSVGTGNLMYGDVNISITPASFLSVTLGSLTMFRPVDGPVATIPVTEGDSGAFLGEELTLAVNLRPLSDLGFQIKGGMFIPNSPVVSDGMQYKISAFMSLSF
ncbi:MAG: hypothetical protein PF518_19550 [Spirochaetaceae bacterium]|nr:hypothetical protein [Spirochaetaceae bacterium]